MASQEIERPDEIVEVGQYVVANVCDAATATSLTIPRVWLGMIGRNAKLLADDGFETDVIVAAAWMSVLRGQPQLMHYIAGDLSLAAAGMRMTRSEYDQKLALYAADKGQRPSLLAEQRARLEERDRVINERRNRGN